MSDQDTTETSPSGRIALHWQILIALALAVIVGLVANESTTIFGAALTEILGFFGGLFINALKMIVVPLIVASIIMGVRNMAGRENFGRVGGKTVGFYVATGFLAVATGLVFVNVINPGGGEAVKALSENMPDVSEQLERVEGARCRGPGGGYFPGHSRQRLRGGSEHGASRADLLQRGVRLLHGAAQGRGKAIR